MKNNLIKKLMIACFAISILSLSCKQNLEETKEKVFDPEYVKVTNERAQKIVDEMTFDSDEKKEKVKNLIAEQYRNLNWIHEQRDKDIEDVKAEDLEDAEEENKISDLKATAEKDVSELHHDYVAALEAELSAEQVDQVKDGMTYGVVPITYQGYLDMIPDLTEEQKKVIWDNLVEAREFAMDGGSSDEKHAWFGKYKGKINNYLSEQGYDLSTLSKEWEERIRQEQQENN